MGYQSEFKASSTTQQDSKRTRSLAATKAFTPHIPEAGDLRHLARKRIEKYVALQEIVRDSRTPDRNIQTEQ